MTGNDVVQPIEARITPPESWRDPALRRLIEALTAAGGPARLVGGCVRDAVLGLPAKDLDIATPLPPEEVARALTAAGAKAIPTGIEHGTFTAIADGHAFEITTLRRDMSTDGRRAVVAFTDDWAADAARRDLTFNALSADLDGRIHDLTGGLADLRAGVVRFVGDPARRIVEDYLRIPRYFRFFARFGRKPPSPETMGALKANMAGVDQLSGERLRSELIGLLELDDPMPGVDLASEVGYWDRLWTEPGDRERLARLVRREVAQGLRGDPIRRLAAFAGAGATPALTERLRLSKAETKRLLAIPAAIAPVLATAPDASLPLRRRIGAIATRDAALIAADDEKVADWLSAAAEEAPPMPITAKDLLAAGAEPGPDIGRRLAELQVWWDESEGAPDRDACLTRMQAPSSK